MTLLTLKALPLGYRFRPTDEELVDYYLRNKINGNDNDVKVIREIDVCKWEPWDLPDLSVVQSNDLEWFFFCPRDQKYPNGPRLNRATGAGYWKATGKDRKIKKRASEIGMKRTLVFYKGRAPRGKRTYWVMHEYRPTIAELDGTHPGQNPFVLCRLFKKLDESVEGSHCDEVEPALSSPTITNSSPGYTQSEIALYQENSALGLQDVTQRTNSLSYQAEDFERRSANILVPLECHGYSDNACDANDHTAAVTASEVDLPHVEYGDWMADPNLDPEDGKLFSPLSAQIWAELGSSDMHYPVPNDFGNFQYGTNEQDDQISEFLHSILNDSKDNYHYGDLETLAAENKTPKYINTISLCKSSVKDSESCSESDQELAQAQLDTEFGPSCLLTGTVDREAPVKIDFTPGAFRSSTSDNSTHVNFIESGDFATGIRIRTRQPKDYSTSTDFVIPQGTAHRRIRMQTKLEVGTFLSCKADLGFGAEEDNEKSKEEKPAENHAADAASATAIGEPQKLTLSESDQEVTVPRLVNSMSQGTVGSDKNEPSVFAKTGERQSLLSPMSTLRRVGAVIVFCVVVAGLWKCCEYVKVA